MKTQNNPILFAAFFCIGFLGWNLLSDGRIETIDFIAALVTAGIVYIVSTFMMKKKSNSK